MGLNLAVPDRSWMKRGQKGMKVAEFGCSVSYPNAILNLFDFFQYLNSLSSKRLSLADPGGAVSTCLPTGSNSFVFAHVFTKKHPRQRSAPPNGSPSPPPPQREILDPPLAITKNVHETFQRNEIIICGSFKNTSMHINMKKHSHISNLQSYFPGN